VQRTLTLTALPGIPLIQKGDDLAALILKSVQRAALDIQSGDVFILAQKIVSKAEGRQVALADVIPTERALSLGLVTGKDPRFVELVLQESREVIRAKPGLLVTEHRLGFICANAGIDRSNVATHDGNNEWVLLLPMDPDASCRTLRQKIEEQTSAQIGLLINDSHGRAWRQGTVGVALGASGVPALLDLRGTPDLFAYSLQSTEIGAADELAAAASIIMGQAGEGFPVVHARGFPYLLREGSAAELIRSKDLDAFR
jgi:coenzyme F420-0:L-glutamate ligase / coenzyme F420-1:gamma-L-glutamate ligase